MAQRSNKELWEHFERVLNQTGQVPKPRPSAIRGDDLRPSIFSTHHDEEDPDWVPPGEHTPPGKNFDKLALVLTS